MDMINSQKRPLIGFTTEYKADKRRMVSDVPFVFLIKAQINLLTSIK